MIELSKLKPLDLVLCSSQRCHGLHVVLEVGKAFVRVRPAQSAQAQLLDQKVEAVDIAAYLRPTFGDVTALPAGIVAMDLNTPPRVSVVSVPAPKPAEPLVVVSVPDPNRKGYTFPTRDDPNPAVILPEESEHLNHNGRSRKVIRVRKSLVGIVLAGVDGAHLVDEKPRASTDSAFAGTEA